MRTIVTSSPAVEFELELRGEGTLRADGEEQPLSLVSARRTKYRPDLPWNVTLRAPPAPRGEFHWGFRHEPVIEGTSGGGRTFQILGFRRTEGPWITDGVVSGDVRGQAVEVRASSGELATVPREQSVTVIVTETNLAMTQTVFRLRTQDGLISGDVVHEPFKLESPVGPAQFWRGYALDQIRVTDSTAVTELPQPRIEIEVLEQHRTPEPYALIEDLSGWLDDLATILTFFSRRSVGHFLTSVTSVSKAETGSAFHVAEAWTPASEAHRKSGEFGLVAPGRLAADSIQTVVEAFQAHELKEGIRSTIGYIAASIEELLLPTATTYAFTALETIVNALGGTDEYPDMVVGASKFKKIAKGLRAKIRAVCGELGLSDEVQTALERKLPELRRRPFVDRVAEIAEDLEVRWNDLWPGVEKLEVGLTATYRRRSQFVHRGTFDDSEASSRDSYRVAHLAERLVYALLECDPEWLPDAPLGGRFLAPADA